MKLAKLLHYNQKKNEVKKRAYEHQLALERQCQFHGGRYLPLGGFYRRPNRKKINLDYSLW